MTSNSENGDHSVRWSAKDISGTTARIRATSRTSSHPGTESGGPPPKRSNCKVSRTSRTTTHGQWTQCTLSDVSTENYTPLATSGGHGGARSISLTGGHRRHGAVSSSAGNRSRTSKSNARRRESLCGGWDKTETRTNGWQAPGATSTRTTSSRASTTATATSTARNTSSRTSCEATSAPSANRASASGTHARGVTGRFSDFATVARCSDATRHVKSSRRNKCRGGSYARAA